MKDLALWGNFLAGLGALSALIISIFQIRRNSKFHEANFWLKLRQMFNEEDRIYVHRELRKGTWISKTPIDKSEWSKIEDYMGLMEVCEGMLQKKIISETVFKNLYEYRIYNICCNKQVVHQKLIYEYYDWHLFYRLLERLYGEDWKDFYTFISKAKIGYNQVKNENALLAKFDADQKIQYSYFIKKLNIEL
ncbi:hypothetical protein [Gilvibacter sediminis]|uniref:hypothetical protein n=1 Tax=Gilvibacter sediminis TaxID=379071 RepID=UPI0023503BF5|nr:hypothetical protein [Gilvibacter sediminis]MDC7998012.1 hypothetical protein [Gilvibacter sediminis]